MSGAIGQSQSLYRKYRPRSFDAHELVGQEHIARTLQNAIALDRVAHAYLFCGPRGTGKTSTARLLAKAVNCLDPDPMARPCNHCAACDAINSGATVDIIEIDAASNRGVDDIRDLREKVKYAPTQLRVKFYIIDEAHQLTRDAFNAFLKTLEEPPPHVKFVLATTEADKLPDTVASRCQRFDFRRVPLEAMVEHLARICRREGLDADDDALRLISRQATGSLRDAEGLLEQLALYDSQDGRPRVSADAVRRVLGLSPGDRVARIVEAVAERDAGAGLRLIAEAAELGEDVHQLNKQLVAYLRSLLHLAAGGRESESGPEARAQAERFSLPELVEMVRAFSSIDAALNRGSYAQLPLELALVDAVLLLRGESQPSQLAPSVPTIAPAPSRAPGTPISSRRPTGERMGEERRGSAAAPQSETTPPVAPVAASRGGNGHAVAPAPSTPTAGPSPTRTAGAAAGSPVNVERLAQNWGNIRRDVKIANSRIAALLSNADPVGIEGERVILVSPYEFHRNKLNDDGARRVVEDVISRYLGGAIQLHCVSPDEARDFNGSGASNPKPVDPEPTVVEPPAEDDDAVRAAKAIFNATEVEPQ